ncbi:MAG TPA: hypothetical protein VFT06_05440, partial [Flavisolibacter sp.]|nr:hypothetical protein [Flavisolibacter sp.]
MSEIQSVPSTPEQIKSASERCLVNTNAVLQKALQRLTAEQRSTIALRCDDLPVVQGTEKDFELVFSSLLQTILQP